LALICIQSWTAFIGHSYLLAEQGVAMPWSVILWLGAVGAVGSLFGVLLSSYLPQALLRRIFAVVLLVLAGSLVLV